ncbi:MAG: cupin [Planctomycetota bacterium]|jgi:quercetin dioxygenase-like cupin family protein
MRLFRFDAEIGRSIEKHGSAGLKFAPVVGVDAHVHVGCLHLEAGGRIGRHPAPIPQLFLVVSGEGWVCGETGDRVPVAAGVAAYWDASESHEAGTFTGMTAIVVEAGSMEAPPAMPEIV